MPELSRFFNHVDGDRVYNADEFAEYFRQVLTSGILNGGTNLQVTCNGTDRISRINPGKAWLEGYFYKNTDDPLQLTHDEAHGSYDRIDRVVLRLDKNTENRYIKAFIKIGIPDVAPVPPELTRDDLIYEISLAQVLIVHNTSVIAANKVTDERLNATVCGLVNSLIQVDTTEMQAQFDGFMVTLSGQGYLPASEKGAPGGVAEQDAFAAHEADNVHVPHLGTTTNVSNAYSVTSAVVIDDTDKFSVKFNVVATGTATLNISSDGTVRTLKKPDGSDFRPKAGIYSFIRDGVNFQLLGEGGEYGTAGGAQTLIGYTLGTENGVIPGTMPSNGSPTLTPTPGSSQAITPGYYSGGSITPLSVIKNKQSGVINLSGSTYQQNITISAVDLTKAVVRIKWYSNSSGKAGYVSIPSGNLTSSTNLLIQIDYTPVGSVWIAWEVIEFNGVRSLQSGLYNLVSGGNVTVSTIITTKSILFFSYLNNITSTDLNTNSVSGYISNSTLLTFYSGSPSNTDSIQWYLIEFN